MLIDDVKIFAKAGDGGSGIVAFNKNKMSIGPTGGDGGKGGDVYVVGIENIGALSQFRHRKKFEAKNGQNGGQQKRSGYNGDDLELKIPVGTVVHDLTTGKTLEITKIGQKELLLKGGKGGRGNFFFRSSRNTTPKEFEEGGKGELSELRFELKLIADVGFVGFPNVGKSTLLNILTNAQIRVANYPFTTLEPNLGVYYELILADIPGLIEGASAGKGLGIKFLKHVERTKTLFHFISAESEDPVKDYHIIRKELETYNPELLEKKEYVFLSKSDTASAAQIKKKVSALKKLNPEVLAISQLDDQSMQSVKKLLNSIKKEKIAL